MAMERITMAENLLTPPEPPVRKSPIQAASNFDLNRRDYQTRIIGNYVSWIDPLTGGEVARIPKIEGGSIPVPEAELDLEGKERDKKEPDKIVDILLTISDMDAETRETDDHKEQFQRAVDILRTYTNEKKLLDIEWQISNDLIELRKADQVMIKEVDGTPSTGKGEEFHELLDELDRTERDLKRYNLTLGDESRKGHISDEEWVEFKTRQGVLAAGKISLRQKITDICSGTNNPNFLTERDKQRAPIDLALENSMKTKLDKKKSEVQEKKNDPGPDEAALRKRLLEDVDPITLVTDPKELAALIATVKPTFTEQLEFYEQQRDLQREGKPNTLPDAEKGLSHFFHEARELGVFDDLEDILGRKYIEWADSMTRHQVINQQDQVQTVPGRSYSDVETEVIAYTEALLTPGKAEYIEHKIRWDKFERKGLLSADRKRFDGIRVAFMQRAQGYMLDSLENTPVSRLSGEWNVHRLDMDILLRKGKQEARDVGEPLYKRESYYKVTLLGRNRQEIELGADQCAENIMKSINDFDINAIQTRVQALVEEIQRKKTLIHSLEGGSEGSAQDTVDQITDSVTNKIDFHILEWAGQNLQMDFFVDYLAKQMRVRGADKMRTIPAMHEGLEGIAIHFLLDPRFRLYYRPQGWKGQMKDDDTVHKFIRGNIQEKIALMLTEYRLKGDSKIKEEEDIERSFYREQLTNVHSWEDFIENFHHLGFIPIPGTSRYVSYKEYVDAQDQKNLLLVPARVDPKKPGKYKPREFKQVPDPNPNNKGKFIPYRILNLDEYMKIEKYLTPAQKREFRQDNYDRIIEEVQRKGVNANSADLEKLRQAREASAAENKNYQTALDRASSAVNTANQVLDIFGESAEMGDPSMVTKESKDFISLREFTLVCKYAILQADQGEIIDITGTKYRVKLSNMNTVFSLVRDRSNAWIKKATRAGYDRSKASGQFVISFLDGEKKGLELINGSNQSGLSEPEWQAFKSSYRKFRKKDYQTKIEEVGSVPLDKDVFTEPEWQAFKNAANKLKSKGYKVETTARLAVGFEETGLTQAQFEAYKVAVAELHKNGFRATIGGDKFKDIIKMKNLKPLKNNFMADYKSMMSQINSKEVREQVAKGYLPIIKGILVRMGFKDRQTVGGTTQQEIDQYTQIIEDSRSFDAMVEGLVYYTATHPDIDRTADGNYPAFSPDAIDYGFQGLNWGMKRLRHVRAFWYANLNRTVPRGVDLVDTMPTLDRLAGEMDFDNILDLAFNINTKGNGMESVDAPALFQWAQRVKTMAFIRGKGEGGIGEGQGGLDKGWGWFEKWLSDANGLWEAIVRAQPLSSMVTLQKILGNPSLIGEDEAEKYVDAVMKVSGRFQPLLTGNEKLLGEDRQALSAGSGYEDNQKKMFRFAEWLRSNKAGSGREEGGLEVQKEIADIIKFFMMPGSFAPGRVVKMVNNKLSLVLDESPSIWEEAMRKLTPSHNPRLLSRALSPGYELSV